MPYCVLLRLTAPPTQAMAVREVRAEVEGRLRGQGLWPASGYSPGDVYGELVRRVTTIRRNNTTAIRRNKATAPATSTASWYELTGGGGVRGGEVAFVMAHVCVCVSVSASVSVRVR